MTPNRIRKRRRSSSFISTIIAGCCCCPPAPFASPSSRCGAFQPPQPPHLLGWSRNNRDPTSSLPSSSSPPPRGGEADRPLHHRRNRLGNSCRRSRSPPPRLTTGGNDDDDDDDDDGGGGGSVLGASLLFAGTAVGAGLLALPAETSDAGFAPSIVGLLFCWAYTYVTSLVTLEASWLSSPPREDDGGGGGGGDGGAGFLSISRMSLGPVGEAMTASLFWFLLTAIIVAYASEGGTLISRTAGVDPGVGSVLFATPFAYLAMRGTSGVDVVNRIFVFGLIASFVGLVGFGLPNVEVSNLSERANWGAVYPRVISIGILSLGAQNVVPTLLRYLDRDPLRTRTAILFGSLLPLILYAIWEAIFLGVVVDPSSDAADGGTGVEAMAALGQVGGKSRIRFGGGVLLLRRRFEHGRSVRIARRFFPRRDTRADVRRRLGEWSLVAVVVRGRFAGGQESRIAYLRGCSCAGATRRYSLCIPGYVPRCPGGSRIAGSRVSVRGYTSNFDSLTSP